MAINRKMALLLLREFAHDLLLLLLLMISVSHSTCGVLYYALFLQVSAAASTILMVASVVVAKKPESIRHEILNTLATKAMPDMFVI